MEKKKNGCINTRLVNTELFPVSVTICRKKLHFTSGRVCTQKFTQKSEGKGTECSLTPHWVCYVSTYYHDNPLGWPWFPIYRGKNWGPEKLTQLLGHEAKIQGLWNSLNALSNSPAQVILATGTEHYGVSTAPLHGPAGEVSPAQLSIGLWL